MEELIKKKSVTDSVGETLEKVNPLKYLEKRGESEFKDVNNLVNTFVSTVEKSLEKFNS